DFIAAIEDCSGRNLRGFFDQWVFRPGHPALSIYYRFDPRARKARMLVRQTQKEAAYRLPLRFRFTGEGGNWTRDFHEQVDKKEAVFEYRLPGEPALAEFDPEHRLLAKVEEHKPLGLWLGQLFSGPTALGRIDAAHAVARWGDAQAVRALGAAFRREPFWGAAAEMARALGSIRTEAALRELLSLLSVPHPKARRAVVAALGGFCSRDAAARLSRLMRSDPSLNVRAEAARALGKLREGKWGGALKKLLKEPSYWDILACGAVDGLAQIRDIRLLPALRKAAGPANSHPARSAAVRALASFVRTAPEALSWIAASRDAEDERVARAALQALSSAGDPASLPVLEAFLKRTPHQRLKVQAEEAIARLKGEPEPK
ncbi:MAG: HEAT repeat domain-containing protein, partial [Elusimicrobiota bacterium]